MYTPAHFRMPPDDLGDFLDRVHKGNLITVDPSNGRLAATFLPWAFVNNDRLTTHLGRVNVQSGHAGQALVILMGDDAYVSEEWLGDGSAPSWNYETVQIRGELVIHTDPDWIYQSWRELLDRFSNSQLDDYDPVWLEGQARACVGAEVRISEVEAKSKLSQNLTEAVVQSVADHLTPTCPALAERMRQVSLPYIAARQARVRAAKPYHLD